MIAIASAAKRHNEWEKIHCTSKMIPLTQRDQIRELTDCISIWMRYQDWEPLLVFLPHTTDPIDWHTPHLSSYLPHSFFPCVVASAEVRLLLAQFPVPAALQRVPFRFHCCRANQFAQSHCWSERFLRALFPPVIRLATVPFAQFRQRATHRWPL